MSYKLTFFAVTNLRRIREYFKSFNQENLATKSIYQKYKKKIQANQAFNRETKYTQKNKTEVLLNRQSKRTRNVIKNM